MTVFGSSSKQTVNVGTGVPGVGGHVYFPRNDGGLHETPGPGSYLHSGGNPRSTQEALQNHFAGTSHELKFVSCPGAAIDRSTDHGYKRAYWTKGVQTRGGLMYLPRHDVNVHGPAERNMSSQTIDGRSPAFAPLREPHLRPKQSFPKDRRFREEDTGGTNKTFKSGIHDVHPPGPGHYIRAVEENKRFVENTMMAPLEGNLHPSCTASMNRSAFGKTSSGAGERPPTPTGRCTWIKGALAQARSSAPDVSVQNITQTQQVISDLYEDVSKASSFLHSSFNVKSQKNARTPLRKNVLEKIGPGAIDSRGRTKMNRFSPQSSDLTRTVNAMT